MPKRVRLAATDAWVQLRLLCTWPEQEAYELVRPIVLFGHSPTERARQTAVSRSTLYRTATAFVQSGMAGLLPAAPEGAHRHLPEEIRRAIREIKAEYAPLSLREIAAICDVRFGHRPSHHTVESVLLEEPLPPKMTRRFPPYHTIADPAQRRLAIIHLHAEGWNIKSIAGYLATSRPTVYATLQRWRDDAFADLADRPHTRKRVALKVDLAAMAEVKRLQENPELGEFRMYAALKQLGIELSPRTCGRILALNRQLYGLERPPPTPRVPKAMPFKATQRHQYWTVDLRYLDMHHLGGGMIYVISILENYSRAILASALSRSQDLAAFLIVLYAAIARFGSPEALVSDSGSIFLAKEARRIYSALGIQKEQIEQGQAWQSYIETTFNIQRRMADWHFARATTWHGLQASHDRWVHDYNEQVHWAHQHRADTRRTPTTVLDWVQATRWTPEELQQIFQTARGERRVKPNGYVRFRHWDLYGERGLARQQVAVWLSADVTAVTIAHGQDPLAQYTATVESDHRHLKEVVPLRLYENPFPPQQPMLWEPSAVEWRLALRRVAPVRGQRRSPIGGKQLTLLPEVAI